MARSNKSSDDESSSSDDDDDDMPLAALGDRKRSVSRTPVKYNEASDESEEEEAEFDDEIMNLPEEEEEDGGDDFRSDDDESEDDDDDDDFDDAPLSSLKSTPTKRKRSTPKPTKKTKPKSKPKKTKPKKKKKPIKRKSTDTLTPNNSTTIITPSSSLYSKSTKGKIIQSLLCRWWYAITWPTLSTLPPSPPPNCDPLDGFPGVYVHTSGPEVGKIVDLRNNSTCPNFKNMVRKDTEELKGLLLVAIEKQRVELVRVEGSGTGVEGDLGVLERWVRKVNGGKADREASKVLKAAGF